MAGVVGGVAQQGSRTRRDRLGGHERQVDRAGPGCASAPPATTSARASREAGVEALATAGGGSVPRARPARARTSRSGLTTSTSASRSTARAAATVRARKPSTRSCRSSASSVLAEPRLGALERADRDDRRDPRVGSGERRANSSTSRASRARPAVVGHDRVGHEGPDAERGDRRFEVGVDGVEDEGVDVAARTARPLPGRSIRTERGQHPVGRALERDATDDAADRDDRDAPRPRVIDPCRHPAAPPGSARSTRAGSTAR